jgi:hypothetical protein
MKGIQYRGQYNVHDKRVIDYIKRNQSLSHVSCDACGSVDKTHARESINNFIKSIENNAIVFNEKDMDIGKPKIFEITYYNSPKICGGC